MKMLDATHHGLYYPSHQRELETAVAPKRSELSLTSLPAAVLLPHASYQNVRDLLHTGLAPTNELRADLIVLLAPQHSKEFKETISLPSSDGIRYPTHSTPFASEVIDSFVHTFSDLILRSDEPFIDEPGWELLLPMITAYHPDSPILPILAPPMRAKPIRRYARLLQSIEEAYPSTLFIVTANANALSPSPRAEEEARALLECLESGNSLLSESRNISGCNIASLEALWHQNWGPRSWRVLATSAGAEGIGDQDVRENHLYHVSAIRGETDDS